MPEPKTSPVCKACGWYGDDNSIRKHVCLFQEGRHADAVAEIARTRFVPPVESTKLGYGHGVLTFEFNDGLSLKVVPRSNGTFRIRDLFVLESLTQEQLLRLVDCLRGLER